MKNLLKVSVFYLLLPNLLFFYYWIFSPLNFVICAVLIAYTFYYFRQAEKLNFKENSFTSKELLWIGIAALAWIIFIGVGGFTWQKEDFYMHNAKFVNLHNSSWPLIFEVNHKYVIYYFGYYLVPMFLAKKIPQFYELLILTWTFFGFFLSSAWLYILLKKDIFKIIFFLFIGSTGQFLALYIFYYLLKIPYPTYPTFPMSLYEQSSWVFNQIIPSIICTAIFLLFIEQKISLKFVIFPISLMFLWAIFPTCILIFVILIWLLINKQSKEILSIAQFSIVPILLIVVPLLLYYASSNGGGISGFIWQFMKPADAVFEYSREILPDATLIFLLIIFFIKNSVDKKMALACLCLMMLLALLRIGLYNDLFHRSIIILYIVIIYLIFKTISTKYLFRRWYLMFFLIISAIIPVKDFFKRIKINTLTTAPANVRYDYFENKTIYDASLKIHGIQDALQYCSKDNSLYERFLAPKNETK